MSRAPAARAALLALTLALSAAPARAELAASPLLPPDHWASQAVSRLDQLGLLGDWLPAQKSIHLQAASEAFTRAEALAASRPDALALVRAWRARLAREFPGLDADRTLLGARVSTGLDAGDKRDASAPGSSPDTLRLHPPRTAPVADASCAVRPASWLAAAATVRGDDRAGDLVDADVAASYAWLALHAGRARPGFGFQPGAGVMLSGNATVDRLELLTTRPVRLPWVFGLVGTWTADTFLARFGGSRWPDHSMLWATSLRWRLHPRFTLGGQRGIIFGGEPWRGFPAWHRALVLLGLDNYRENNMLTLSARWRMPTERVLPLVWDVDWGTDDDPQAAVKIPGLVTSLTAPALGPASVGVEYAFFGRACCRPEWRSAPWYIHGQYRPGWTVDQTPLGDPLGGNGRALRLHTAVDPSEHLRVASTVWVQDRFTTSLYSPAANGRSYGARVQAELRSGRAGLELRGSHERGDAGWRETDAALRATLYY